MNIQITKNAWSKINEILKQQKNPYGFIYSAKTGGCNGFNFDLNPLTEEFYKELKDKKFITILTYQQSKVYVDPLSELYLLGTTIDYIKEDFSKNIYESKFTYEVDKNLMTKCGCGVSFSPKEI